MSIEELINLFKELISLMELTGENPFKIRAYEKATDQLRIFSGNLKTLLEEIESGKTILSFGPQIIKDLKEIQATGELSLHQALLSQIPRETLELLNIRGLGPKKIIQLKQELKIESIENLSIALEEGKLKSVKGFGEKTLNTLKENLDFYLSSRGQFLIDVHEKILGRILNLSSDNLIPIGPSKEKEETFTEVNLALKSSYLQNLETSLHEENINYEKSTLNSPTIHFNVNSTPVTITIQEEDNFNSLKNEFQNQQNNQTLNQTSLKGLLHIHSTYSDGLHSVQELATEAIRLGYSYIGISDHSQSAGYAGGLRLDEIKAQHLEIDRLNEKLAPFRIFKGIESDILLDGSLDYSDNILASFDFIVSSVHSNFTLSKREMTDRIIKALKNKYTTILGHPTGRLLLKRKGYELDIQEVLKVAKEEGVVVEINSNPRRLDLSWQNMLYAKERDLMLAITPDAHSKDQLSLVEYGILMANKAGIQESQILNHLNSKECSNFFKLRRG